MLSQYVVHLVKVQLLATEGVRVLVDLGLHRRRYDLAYELLHRRRHILDVVRDHKPDVLGGGKGVSRKRAHAMAKQVGAVRGGAAMAACVTEGWRSERGTARTRNS